MCIGSTSIYLSYSALYFNEDEKNWIVAENDTCLFNPSLYAQPIFATALAQFQIFRFTFKLFPQQYLSFNHEAWAYPFALSVPAAACALQVLVYLIKGSICDQLPLKYFLIKLNIPADSASYASKIQVTALMLLTTGIIETLIQLEKHFNTLQTWIRKKNSRVHPAPTLVIVRSISDERMNYNDGQNLITLDPNNLAIGTAASSLTDSQTTTNSYLDSRTPSSLPTNENSAIPSKHIRYYFAEKLTIFVIINFFVFFFYTIIFGYGNVIVYIAIVSWDFFYFALPTVFVLNSNKIVKFIKHRFTQFNQGLGNY